MVTEKDFRLAVWRLVLLALGLVVLRPISGRGQEVLLRYDMTNSAPSFDDPVNKVAGRSLQVGTGVGTFTLAAPLPYASAPVCQVSPAAGLLPLANALAALAANCMLVFDFQVGWGVASVDLTDLTFDIARGGANTNRGFGVFITTPMLVDVSFGMYS